MGARAFVYVRVFGKCKSSLFLKTRDLIYRKNAVKFCSSLI